MSVLFRCYSVSYSQDLYPLMDELQTRSLDRGVMFAGPGMHG